MNLTALFIALIGVVIVLVAFFIANKLRNKALSITIKIVGAVVGFLAMAAFPVKDLNVSSQAGTYWFVMLIIAAIVSKIFFKAKI